jgi:hypothetical protein
VSVRAVLPIPLISDSLVLRTLLAYLTARAGRFPRGVIKDADLSALKNFVAQHPALSERCGMTEDEMGLLTRAVGGV